MNKHEQLPEQKSASKESSFHLTKTGKQIDTPARISIINLLLILTLASFVFAGMLISQALGQQVIVLSLLVLFHFWNARDSFRFWGGVFGLVASVAVVLLIPHMSGTWFPGRSWVEMLYPVALIRWVTAAVVGKVVRERFSEAFAVEAAHERVS